MRNNSPLEASEELLLSQVGAAGFEPHDVADPKRGVVPELVDARRGTRGRAAWCGLSRGKWRRTAFNPRRQTRRVFVLGGWEGFKLNLQGRPVAWSNKKGEEAWLSLEDAVCATC